LTRSVTPTSYSLGSGNSGVFTVDFSVSNTTTIGYYTVTLKAYTNEDSNVYATKDIVIAVEPLEQTKEQINQTYDDFKSTFASISASFNLIPPNSEANYTIANRTYYRLLNILQDIENKLKLGNYLEAQSLLEEANSSLVSFKEEVNQIAAGGGLLLPGVNLLTLVAIILVIVVIGGFLAYLMLPQKKRGFHPATGYIPKGKVSIGYKVKHLFSRLKMPKISKPAGQKSLSEFEKRPQQPAQPAAAPADKKTYMEGYHRLDQFPLSYDKEKFKEKKK